MPREFVEFGGRKFYRMSNGYFKGNPVWCHVVVWESAHGKIPEGYEIHHADFNPSNNAIENLRCLTIPEHKKIHVANRPQHMHVCENCGTIYEARNCNKKNRFCSKSCRIAWLRKQGYYNVKKNCEFCGREFVTRKDAKARVCSASCAKKANPHPHRANGQFAHIAEKVANVLSEEQKMDSFSLQV